MAVTSGAGRSFNPRSADAVNFLLADARGAFGPFLNVFLVSRRHWSQSQVGVVTTIFGALTPLAIADIMRDPVVAIWPRARNRRVPERIGRRRRRRSLWL